jgi:VWFA-related protein
MNSFPNGLWRTRFCVPRRDSSRRLPRGATQALPAHRRSPLPIACLAAPLLLAVAANAQPPESFQISVDVSLVVLQATVSGRDGHFPPDLTEQNFTVYEDGVRQTITLFRHEDVPVTVGLIVDHSGSMFPKLREVVAAARSFVESSNDRDQLFVVNFHDRVSTALNHGSPFLALSDHLALENAILGLPAIGMTRLYDAVREAQEQVRAGTAEKKALILISDGGDNASKHLRRQRSR